MREQLSKAAAQQRLAAPLRTMRTCPDRPPTAKRGQRAPWAGPPGRTSAARGARVAPARAIARRLADVAGCALLRRREPSIWAATFGGGLPGSQLALLRQ